MKNNKSEVWNFSYYNGGVRIKFSESVDIHKAFEAMMVGKDQFGKPDRYTVSITIALIVT